MDYGEKSYVCDGGVLNLDLNREKPRNGNGPDAETIKLKSYDRGSSDLGSRRSRNL